MTRPTAVALFAASLFAVLLGGCEGNPVKDLAQSAGIGGEPKPAPDFVSRTRVSSYEYMPIGVAPPKRAKPKTKDQVADSEADLDAVRSRNERQGAAARSAGESANANPAAPPRKPPAP